MNKTEKRLLNRWPIHWPAKIKLKDKKGNMIFDPCYINDLNFKGMQISLKETLPEDKSLSLNVILSGEFILDVKVKVIWHRAVASGLNAYGLYFIELKDIDREKIFKFIYTNFSTEVIKKWWEGVV